jgi:hypothetical protein
MILRRNPVGKSVKLKEKARWGILILSKLAKKAVQQVTLGKWVMMQSAWVCFAFKTVC